MTDLLTQDQQDAVIVAEASKLVCAGKDLNAYVGAVLLRLLEAAERRGRAGMREEAAQVADVGADNLACPTHYSAAVARNVTSKVAETIRALPDFGLES